MFSVIKAFIGKYAIYGLLALSATLAVGLGVYVHLNAQKAAQVASLTQQNEKLQKDLKAEKDWSDKQSAALADRDADRSRYDGDSERKQQELDKQYEKHRDWADASVPDDVADSLQQHLGSR